MQELLFKGPADVLANRLSQISAQQGATEVFGNQQVSTKAISVMAKIDDSFDGNILKEISLSCTSLIRDLNILRASTPLAGRWLECLDKISSSMNASSLAMPIRQFVPSYASVGELSRVQDMAAFFDEPKYSFGRRIKLEKLEDAANSLAEALAELSIPDSVREYISNEIEHIKSILDKIDLIGTQDIWERMYFASESIENATAYQTSNVKNAVQDLSRKWKPLVYSALIRASIVTGGSAAFFASVATVHQYLESPEGSATRAFLEQHLTTRALPPPSVKTEN